MVHFSNRVCSFEETDNQRKGRGLAEIFERPPDIRGDYEPLGRAELTDRDERSIRLRVGSATVEVTALAPDLFRVGMFPEGRTPRYASEAIAKEDWEPLVAEI